MAPATPKRRLSAATLGKRGNHVGGWLPKHAVGSGSISLSDPVTSRAGSASIGIERRRRRLVLANILECWPRGETVSEPDWGPARGDEA